MAEGGETQILKGANFSVTTREIKFAGGSIAITRADAPQIENATTKTTVLPTLLTIAGAFALIGLGGLVAARRRRA